MGKSSRDKGHNFERRIARELREMGIETAQRGFQTRGGTAEEPDVKGVGKLAIECKAHKKVNRRAAWFQAFENAKPGQIPIAICKDDYRAPVVVLALGAVMPEYAYTLEGQDESDTSSPLDVPLVEIEWEYFKKYLLRRLAGLEEEE